MITIAQAEAATPLQGTLETPLHMPGEGPLPEEDFEAVCLSLTFSIYNYIYIYTYM